MRAQNSAQRLGIFNSAQVNDPTT